MIAYCQFYDQITCRVKLKFHWDQFPHNFPIANVTVKSPTSYEEVGRVASLLRGSYKEAGDFDVEMVWRRHQLPRN